MTRKQKTYIAWLNNAYGQEVCMARMYRMHAKDVSRGLNEFPELKQRLLMQAEISLEQAERMKQCYERVSGRKLYAPKKWLGQVMGLVLGWTGDVTIDKVIMNSLTDYGMIQFEVAAYRTLIASARAMDDKQTVSVCQDILEEELALAHWLEQRLDTYGPTFLKRVAP